MYEILFTNNFFINFLNSFFFIVFNIFFSYVVHYNLLKKNHIIIKVYQPLFILFFIFAVISILFNFLILTNNYQYFRETLILILLFQLLYISSHINLVKKINFKFFKVNKVNLFILLALIIFYLISILPISDADSIALHQNLSNEIYLKGLRNLEIQKNLPFTIYSNTQNLLIISPILNSDNFGSQLNLIILIFFCFFSFKNNKNFILVLLACPLIIYFISAQKLQFFFGILYLVIFIIVNDKLIKNKISLFLTIFLLFFYSSGNISYILFTVPLYIYLFIEKKRDWKEIIIYSIISVLIIFLPLLIIKQIYFQNFLAPFFDNILGTNKFLYNAYSYSIRSTAGWLYNSTNFELYLKPFLSFNISGFTESFGIIFLLMLLNFKLQRRTKYFSLIIILLVISTGQILPRYYLESFLILAYYFNIQSLLPKLVISSYSVLIVTISLGFVYFAYFDS